MRFFFRIRIIFCAIIILLLPDYGASEASQRVETFMLKNGMQLVLIPNNKMPVISHMVWYKIGAADEQPGKSGIAHFLEHLMFKSTNKYKTGEFSKKIAKIGGNDNAFTDTDYTAYFQNIPKESIELVMELEADRMQNLRFDKDEVTKERDVILEERRMRIDNNPHAELAEQMKATLYQNHPYHRPIIGWYHEMATLNEKDAQDWHMNYYNPANAILVVSGDITMAALKPLAEKYYGKIPAGKKAVRNNFTQEPEQIAPRTLTLKDSKIKKAEMMRYYLAPSRLYGKNEYSYALCLLSYIFGASETSQLYQDMVVKNKKAVDVGSYYDDLKIGPSIFAINVIPSDGITFSGAEEALDNSINRIVKEGVNEQDLRRAKKAIIANSIYAKEDLKNLAKDYGAALALGLGVDYVENWERDINAVTAKQVQDAAQYIFNKKQSVTGYLLVGGGK